MSYPSIRAGLVGRWGSLPGLAFTVFFGLWHSGRDPLWLDEASTYTAATGSRRALWTAIERDNGNQAMHYAFLRPWLAIHESVVWARALSLVFGIFAVLFFWQLVRRWFGAGAALWCGVALALNPIFIRYNQEVRAYTLAILLTVLCVLLVDSSWSRSSYKGAACFGMLAALNMYAVPVSVLAVGAVALTYWGRIAVSRTRWCASAALGFVAVSAPVIVQSATAGSTQVEGIPDTTPRRVVQIAAQLIYAVKEGHKVGYVAALLAALVIAGMFLRWRAVWGVASKNDAQVSSEVAAADTEVLATRATWLWLLVPPLVLGAVSLMLPLLAARYLIAVVPAVALVVGRAAHSGFSHLVRGRKVGRLDDATPRTAMRHRIASLAPQVTGALALCLLVVSFVNVAGTSGTYRDEPWDEVASLLEPRESRRRSVRGGSVLLPYAPRLGARRFSRRRPPRVATDGDRRHRGSASLVPQRR